MKNIFDCIGTLSDTSIKTFKKKHIKHAVHNTDRLVAQGTYARRAPDNCPACPCIKTALDSNTDDKWL